MESSRFRVGRSTEPPAAGPRRRQGAGSELLSAPSVRYRKEPAALEGEPQGGRSRSVPLLSGSWGSFRPGCGPERTAPAAGAGEQPREPSPCQPGPLPRGQGSLGLGMHSRERDRLGCCTRLNNFRKGTHPVGSKCLYYLNQRLGAGCAGSLPSKALCLGPSTRPGLGVRRDGSPCCTAHRKCAAPAHGACAGRRAPWAQGWA